MVSSTTEYMKPNELAALGFTQLSSGISLFEPAKSSFERVSSTDPTLIIICSWAFAQPKHIVKYVKPHRDRFPTASILLVQNIISNMIWKPDRLQMSFFQPGAAAVQTHIQNDEHSKVLLHVFSNGGSHAAVQLSQACRETCGGFRLPIDAMILDSCPGQPRFGPTIAALTQGVPSKNPVIKAVARLLAYGTTSGTALFDLLNISEPAAWKLYRKLNDPADVFLLKNTADGSSRIIPRAYVYSESDTMIMVADVEGHARIAREKLASVGFNQDEIAQSIRLEEFVGSAHVNHVKLESERYWNTVSQTWLKAGGSV